MSAKVNLAEKLASFEETWVPKVVGELNGQYVKVAKFEGEYVWHQHADEDELFLVLEGRIRIALRDREVVLDVTGMVGRRHLAHRNERRKTPAFLSLVLPAAWTFTQRAWASDEGSRNAGLNDLWFIKSIMPLGLGLLALAVLIETMWLLRAAR